MANDQPSQRRGVEVLSAYLLDSLDVVREISAGSLERYNEISPHDALVGSVPQARYRRRVPEAGTPVYN